MCRIVLFLISCFIFCHAEAQTSVAGLFPLDNSGRLVWNFNAGWRFHLGDVADAETKDFNDTSWEVVSTPHTVQLMPAETMGYRRDAVLHLVGPTIVRRHDAVLDGEQTDGSLYGSGCSGGMACHALRR